MRKKRCFCICMTVLQLLIAGCSADSEEDSKYPTEYPSSDAYSIDELLLADSPGTQIFSDANQQVEVDYSNVSLGYIRVKRLKDDGVKLKLQVIKKDYTLPAKQKFVYYDLYKVGEYETFPLIYGSGVYSIDVWQNTTSNNYKITFTEQVDVGLMNEQIPFLYPNQTVDYDESSKAIQKAFELCKKDSNNLQRIKTLYDYVVTNITYDEKKSEATKNTYVLPVIDETFETGKGICFDYAALLAAMCRSQHIPCKVVVGDTSLEYHAWVEVWLEGKGWVNPEILFASDAWTRMDPTYAASKADYDGAYETIYEY